jgi:hypothetical protein
MSEIKPAPPELGDDHEHPAKRIDRDAGLSPGAVQNGGAAGAAIGGRKGGDVFRDDTEEGAD